MVRKVIMNYLLDYSLTDLLIHYTYLFVLSHLLTFIQLYVLTGRQIDSYIGLSSSTSVEELISSFFRFLQNFINLFVMLLCTSFSMLYLSKPLFGMREDPRGTM